MGFVRLDPRGFWFTMHQWAGLAGLVFLIVVGATGSALAYRWSVDRWLNPQLFDAPARGQVQDIPDRPDRVDMAGLFALIPRREH